MSKSPSPATMAAVRSETSTELEVLFAFIFFSFSCLRAWATLQRDDPQPFPPYDETHLNGVRYLILVRGQAHVVKHLKGAELGVHMECKARGLNIELLQLIIGIRFNSRFPLPGKPDN